LSAALKAGGLRDQAPADGAFYLYARTSGFAPDSSNIAKRLLKETGVAATPGWDFDPDGGGAWMRFSYAGGERDIAEAAGILTDWFRRG
jgi:aspartate/methionine/tyrosine aminotransferase